MGIMSQVENREELSMSQDKDCEELSMSQDEHREKDIEMQAQ